MKLQELDITRYHILILYVEVSLQYVREIKNIDRKISVVYVPQGTLVCQESILGHARTYVEKHTAMYAYFLVQNNQIYIMVSTEELHISRNFPGIICVLRVFLRGKFPGKLYWEIPPLYMSQGGDLIQNSL